MMSVSKYLAVVAIFLVVTGCARTYQARNVETTDFLGDYSMLKEGNEDEALLSYWKKGVNWARYKKIILEPVVIKKIPDSELNEMTHADNYRLKELLDYRMQEALKQGFRLVNKPGADTLLVQFAITDVETSTVLLDMFSSVYPSARTLSALKHLVTGTESFVGKASIEGKIIDSTTGDLLMASADARAGGKTLIGSTNELDDIEESYKYWAIQLSYQLCFRQGRLDCKKPE
ncbi:DUF3313 domain-containing protein [Methyloglobulus sp.]|uniref:DUF3313 domain-containing protein n=1 Tax=Methyloglobulus sp. TaxID=2518622 RepID=UPI0032B73561